MAIIVFQHDSDNRPGRLGSTLRDHAFKLDVRRLDQGDPVPVDYDNVDGVITLGGVQNVNERHAWIDKECAFIRGAHERNLPVIGCCLGAQLIGHALGGEVGVMTGPEVGYVDVTLTPAGQTDTVLSGIAWKSPQFSKHWYEVRTLPPGSTVLAGSNRCPHQAFRVGMRTYGFQYHFEADDSMIDALIGTSKTALHQGGLTSEEFAEQRATHSEMFARLSDRLCVNIATYLIPRVATMTRV